MNGNDVSTALQTAVLEGDQHETGRLVRVALAAGSPPEEILSEGLIPGMQRARRAVQGRARVPAGDPHQRPRHVHRSRRTASSSHRRRASDKGTVVLGTVEGDLHDIGKRLVGMLLARQRLRGRRSRRRRERRGFRRGRCASTPRTSSRCRRCSPPPRRSSAASSTRSPTPAWARRVKVMVGGAPVSQALAAEVGADGFADDCVTAVDEAARLVAAQEERMTPFTRQRFREICRGERLGDFGILGNGIHIFWPETLPAWVGAGRARRASPTCTSRTTARRAPSTSSSASTPHGRWPRSTAAWTQARRCIEYVPGVSAHNHSFLLDPPHEPQSPRRGREEPDRGRTAPASPSACSRTRPSTCRPGSSIPCRDRRSWEAFKERLDPDTPTRYPADWRGVCGAHQRARLPGVDGGRRVLRLHQHVGRHRGPHVPLLRRPATLSKT